MLFFLAALKESQVKPFSAVFESKAAIAKKLESAPCRGGEMNRGFPQTLRGFQISVCSEREVTFRAEKEGFLKGQGACEAQGKSARQ